MDRFIPYRKLSKRKRRELDRTRRNTWNGLSPVTRRKESKKVYSRKNSRQLDPENDPSARF